MNKTYPTEVVLSMYTGVLLCNFNDMHELAEYLTGGSVWTHQFAHRPFVDELATALKVQHPSLADVDAGDVNTSNWEAFRDAQIAKFGETLGITPMGSRPQHYSVAFTEPLKKP